MNSCERFDFEDCKVERSVDLEETVDSCWVLSALGTGRHRYLRSLAFWPFTLTMMRKRLAFRWTFGFEDELFF